MSRTIDKLPWADLEQAVPTLAQNYRLVDRLGSGNRGLQRGRIGHADVLAGQDHQTTRDETRVLPRLDHACEVVQGRIDVAATHALDEGADHVIVLVAVAVVSDCRRLHGDLNVAEFDRRATAPSGHDETRRGLERGEQPPSIATRHTQELLTRLLREVNRAVETAPVDAGAIDQLRQIGVVERFQGEYEAAGEQRRDEARCANATARWAGPPTASDVCLVKK